jgi:hypothetical protein
VLTKVADKISEVDGKYRFSDTGTFISNRTTTSTGNKSVSQSMKLSNGDVINIYDDKSIEINGEKMALTTD